MKPIYFLLFVVASVLVACHKEALFYSVDSLQGKVFIEDKFFENSSTIASGASVYLATNTKAEPYLTKTNVTKEGSFTITHQPIPKEGVYLVAKYIDTNGIPYTGSSSLPIPNKDADGNIAIMMSPQYPQGILKVQVTDQTSANQPVKGAEVYLFENSKQASSIKETTANGIIQSYTTNSSGTAFFYNLNSGTYFVVGKISTALGVIYTETKMVTVDANISQAAKSPSTKTNLSLQYVTPNAKLQVTITDGMSVGREPLKGMKVYLFSSPNQAISVTEVADPTPDSYNRMLSTNEKGQVQFENLEAITYYIGVRGDMPAGKKVRYMWASSVTLTANDDVKLPSIPVPYY